jgi:hypothetical protein
VGQGIGSVARGKGGTAKGDRNPSKNSKTGVSYQRITIFVAYLNGNLFASDT